MSEEQELLDAAPHTLTPVQVVQVVRGAHGQAWLDGLGPAQRSFVAGTLKQALVDGELSGSYTTPDLQSAFASLGGTEADLDEAVLTQAAVRRERGDLSPAGLAVVWARLIHVQDLLSEGEVRAWLSDDMIRGLASKSATWTRFSAIVLGDWARKPAASPTENSLAQYLIGKHPHESAGVLAQAMREDPAGAERLADRIEAGSPKTLAALAGAIVDDASIPAGLRVILAGRAGESVRARARDMVVRELGVTDEHLAKLAPGPSDDEPEAKDETASPAVQRLAWNVAGVAVLITAILSFSFKFALVVGLVLFGIAWLVGREGDGSAD